MSQPRALDHLVLPTASLAVARDRLTTLGFTVAPDGVHPFGTVNCCIYLADGTFLEPLAIGDHALVDAAIAEGNSFVAGDRQFRTAQSDEGFSAIVLKSDDAEADARDFMTKGIAGGPTVAFSRPSVDLEGHADTASFLLAFAAHDIAPDHYFFTCERRRAPQIDRSALQAHLNGVQRLLTINAVSADAHRFAGFIAAMAGGDIASVRSGSIDVALANCTLSIRADNDVTSTRLTGITFAVPDLAVTRDFLHRTGVGYEMAANNALTVRASAGQGADFTFEEAP